MPRSYEDKARQEGGHGQHCCFGWYLRTNLYTKRQGIDHLLFLARILGKNNPLGFSGLDE